MSSRQLAWRPSWPAAAGVASNLAKAIEQCLHPQSPTDANWAAGLTAAFCGLLRGAEFALQEGEVFDPSRHLTRADVKFFEKDGVWYAIIRMRPAKKAGATKTLPLVLGGGGTLLDPVAALKHLSLVGAQTSHSRETASTTYTPPS